MSEPVLKLLLLFASHLSCHTPFNNNHLLPSIEQLLRANCPESPTHRKVTNELKLHILTYLKELKIRAVAFCQKQKAKAGNQVGPRYPDLTQNFQELLLNLNQVTGFGQNHLRVPCPIQNSALSETAINANFTQECLANYLNRQLGFASKRFSKLHQIFASMQSQTQPHLLLGISYANLQEKPILCNGIYAWKQNLQRQHNPKPSICERNQNFFYSLVQVTYVNQNLTLGSYILSLDEQQNLEAACLLHMPISQQPETNMLVYKLLSRLFTQLLLETYPNQHENHYISKLATFFWCFNWIAPYWQDNARFASLIVEALGQIGNINLHLQNNLDQVALLCRNYEEFAQYFTQLWPLIICESLSCH